jgi:hypothetical protein
MIREQNNLFCNNKFWEELISCFALILHGHYYNRKELRDETHRRRQIMILYNEELVRASLLETEEAKTDNELIS